MPSLYSKNFEKILKLLNQNKREINLENPQTQKRSGKQNLGSHPTEVAVLFIFEMADRILHVRHLVSYIPASSVFPPGGTMITPIPGYLLVKKKKK